jgi:hypothetical protein
VTVHGYIGMVRNTVMSLFMIIKYGEEYSDVTVHGYIGMMRNTVM